MSKHSPEPFISSISVSDEVRCQLHQLQQSLGLRKEIIDVIEAQVTQAYEQKLQQYEQAFTRAIHQQYPLSDERQQLQQLQQRLELREEIINKVETQVTQAYEQKLKQYEQAFIRASRQQYPLSDDAYQQLQQLQQRLELRSEIIDVIEAQVTQAYEQKLQQYKQAFIRASHQQYPFNQDTCHQLQRLQQELGLSNNIVAEIEKRITAPIEAKLQQKLQKYEQAFTRAIKRQPLSDGEVLKPLSDGDREVLEYYRRRVLNLNEEITQSIEEQVTQAYEQKLQQYEQAFTRAIHQQYPFSNQACQSLQLLQRNLELTDKTIESIAAKVIQAYEQKLQQYEEALTWASQRQYPFSDEDREFVEYRRQQLNLSNTVADLIEAKITETYKPTLPEPEELVSGGIKQPNLSNDITYSSLLTEPKGNNPIPPIVAPIKKSVTKQGRGHKEKVRRRRLLLKATTVVAAALVSVSLADYAYKQSRTDQSAKAALEIAKISKERKNPEECVNQAKLVLQQSHFYTDAQNLLKECQRLQDEKWLVQAQELAKKNNFKDAIATANKVQAGNNYRSLAAQLIDQWSENILKQAEGRYKEAHDFQELENAIDLTKAIPTTSYIAKNAEETIKKWQTEWNKNETYLEEAQNASSERKWQEAINQANQVRILGQEVKPDNLYWQNNLKPIIEEAEKQIAASNSQKIAVKPALDQRVVRSGPPRRVVRYQPPKRVVRSGPPRRIVRSGPPRRIVRSGPPQRTVRYQPPRRVVRSGPPQRTVRYQPPRRVVRSGPPRRIVRSGPPRRTVRSGPPQQTGWVKKTL